MSLSAHALAVGTFVPMLGSLSRVLDKGAAYAVGKPVDVGMLVGGRLAPDMYTLAQQVQLACYHALDSLARLTGGASTAPEMVLGETLDGLVSRIARTVEALDRAPEAAFAGAEDRAIVIQVPGGAMEFEMTAEQFLRDWALPHFYFHVVTAYDILRHCGVDIGKRDYVGGVGRYLRPVAAS